MPKWTQAAAAAAVVVVVVSLATRAEAAAAPVAPAAPRAPVAAGVAAAPLDAVSDPYERYVRTSPDFRRVRQDPAALAKAWPAFTYMPWTAHWTIGYTPESGRWSLAHGYNGAFVDRSPAADKLAWIEANGLRFYVDHAAGKGDLHLWDGDAVKPHLAELRGTGVRPRPVNAAMVERLKGTLKANITASRSSPLRAAYALDDEASWGHFVSPTMWRVTDDPAAYPAWLRQVYGPAAASVRDRWASYDDVRPKLRTWTLADFDASPLMDQWTFNDALWANTLGGLVEYANELDPATPCGIVGGQAPSPFGGYDYARLMRKVQFVEAYNLGSSQAIIRSFNPGNALPTVTTHFHKSVDDTVWQAWYYLAHGNRGFIGWVEGWFDGQTPKPFHDRVGPTLLEVEKVSKRLAGGTWRHDGVGLYYSHPSVQLGWILDAEAHGNTWPNRNGDHRLGASHNVRHAWENMLRDAGLQYSFLSYADVVQDGVPTEYKVIVLPACLCLSDAEGRRLRAFVEGGGTLVADYLPGAWDQHGRGRPAGGALDDVFGVRHDPKLRAADLFGGRLWAEVDQDAHFSSKSYAEFLGGDDDARPRDPSGFNKVVRGMPTATVHRFGKGTAVLMNLSPQWYNAYRAEGPGPAARRETFTRHLPVKPQVWVEEAGGGEAGGEGAADAAFGSEVTTWQVGNRTFLFLTSNPEVAGTELGGGNAVGLRTMTLPVTLAFASPVSDVRDERSGDKLPDGPRVRVRWTTNEAVVLSFKSGGPGGSPPVHASPK